MITYIKEGNIFTIENVHNYAHGCNCAGAMGKGIALQFKHLFPEMYVQYKELCKDHHFKLGDCFVYKHEKGFVFNLGTQQSWKTKAQLSAIQNSFEEMLNFAKENKVFKIALPKIGSGLGGQDWQKVKEIIENLAANFPQIELFIVEEFKG